MLNHLDAHAGTFLYVVVGKSQNVPLIQDQVILANPIVRELLFVGMALVSVVAIDLNRQASAVPDPGEIKIAAAVAKIGHFILRLQMLEMTESGLPDLFQKHLLGMGVPDFESPSILPLATLQMSLQIFGVRFGKFLVHKWPSRQWTQKNRCPLRNNGTSGVFFTTLPVGKSYRGKTGVVNRANGGTNEASAAYSIAPE